MPRDECMRATHITGGHYRKFFFYRLCIKLVTAYTQN